jgi:glycine dehydrogenase subunit 1
MRYLPLTPADRTEMLGVIGAATIDDLFVDVPAAARKADLFDLPLHAGEMEVERALSALAAKNRPAGAGPFFCGAGAYKHHVPATVDHIIQRSEFLTSYTPYQPEIAQGTLQVLFEFQTQVAALTGLEVANASMYDGSTACAEAVMMAQRVTRRKKAVLSGGLHPHYAAVTQTIAHAEGMDITRQAVAIDAEAAVLSAIDAETACVVVQTPNVFGVVTDVTKIAEAAHAAGALLIVVTTEAVSYGLLKSPGEMGADIAVGEGQSIGVGLNYGGPYIGLFAARGEVRPPDAGPPLRRDRGRRGRAGFRADACRPANSTSAARRRRPTSAPTRASARWPSPST